VAAPRPATVSPDGRSIRSINEVGRPGTYTEVVVPRTPPPRPSRPLTYVQPAPRPTSRPLIPAPLPTAASTYTVSKGDTLGHIAQKHGVTTRDLIRLNNINEPSKLLIGQRLSIPAGSKHPSTPTSVQAPAGAATHKVVGGESVSVIAQKYGVKTADVLAANNLNRDSVIRVGQTLVIPGAKNAVVGRQPAPAAPAPRVDPPKTTHPAGTDVPAPPKVTPGTTPPVPAPGVQPIPLPQLPAPPAVAPAAPTGTVDPAFKSYTVKENEDVYSVAIKWGIAPTELRQLNNLSSSELTPGQVLRIPE